MNLFRMITRLFGNLFITFNFLSIYMLYLYIYENDRFHEIVINVTHYSIKTYSYLQIYSRKTKQLYLTYVHPSVCTGVTFLNTKIRETELYNKYSSFFKMEKEEDEDEYEDENDSNSNVENREYTLVFIKDNEIIDSIYKIEFFNYHSTPEFDFIICEMIENGVTFHKIFYELPTKEEDFEFKNIYCDVRSFTILPLNENAESYPINFVSDQYYFWVENNVIKKCFLDYFLKTYCSLSLEEINDYKLQIITKDIKFLNIRYDQNESFQILENGIDVISNIFSKDEDKNEEKDEDNKYDDEDEKEDEKEEKTIKRRTSKRLSKN